MAVRAAPGALFNAGNKYAKFRPTYPPRLYHAIERYNPAARPPKGSGSLAVDVGTGTGQVAQELSTHYDRVIGLDLSASMLANAVQLPNVEYRVSGAEKMAGITDHSVDLVAVAQAAHWFDIPQFITECKRVLKPTGTLAVWTYNLPVLPDAAADRLLRHFHFETLKPHWEQNRYLVTDAYPHLPLLPMEHAERHKIDSSKTMAVEEFVSYVDTWSAMNTWRKSSPEAATAALAQLKQDLMRIWPNPDHSLDVHFEITLLLGRPTV